MARAGLLPGYVAGRRGTPGAAIPRERAEAFAVVLRAGAATRQLAELMRQDPAEVVKVAEALTVLARSRQEDRLAGNGEEAA